jgi:hypothetical protein
MGNWSIATWYTWELFSGDVTEWIDFHLMIGAEASCLKFGSGNTPWEGLEPYVAKSKDAGLGAWGWWFLYGDRDEETIIADHAEYLGLDGLALDIESAWENKAGFTNSARRAKAKKVMDVIRARYSGQVALVSWWKPSVHPKTPVDVFLEQCDWNMPMDYWIGRFSDERAVEVVDTGLEEYSRLANWPASKTIPILAAYGQSYKVGSNTYWWKTTITQMEAAHDFAISRGCPGVNWWCLNYLMGLSGHEAPKVVETKMIEKIKSLDVPAPPPPPGPTPSERIRTDTKKIREVSEDLDKIANELEE